MRQAVESAPDEVLANAAITKTVDGGRGEWADILGAIYSVTIEHFGGRTIQELDPEQSFDSQTRDAMDWISKHGAERSALLTDTSKAEAKKVLRDGLAQGRSIPQMARELEKHYEERGRKRATVLARTEVIAASSFGSITAARQSGVAKTKTWLDSSDERVRDVHERADGQTVALNEPFIVDGVEMDYPGDPTAPPHLVIACRCAMTFGI